MTAETQQVLEEALRLTPTEKAELIEALLHSFDPSSDRPADSAWAKEIESRIDAYEAGKIPADSAEAVSARINRR